MFASGPELMHVPAGDHPEQSGKGCAGAHFSARVPRPCENLRDDGGGLRGHLFDSADQHQIIKAGGHGGNYMKESGTRGGAGSLEAGARHALDPESSGYIWRQVILAHERRPGEVAQVKSLDLIGTYMRLGETFGTRLDGQGAQIAIRESPKRGLSDPNHRHRSHISFRLAPE